MKRDDFMKISTKGRYALRLMLDVALHAEEKPVRIKDISARQEISDKYLEQIVSILTKAGFVKSSRGPQGGYKLMRKPENYTVGQILRLIEGSLAPVACMEGDVNECTRKEICATLLVWEKLNDAITNVVDNITLADLIVWQKKINNKEAL
jgi:Rrf2 family protein